MSRDFGSDPVALKIAITSYVVGFNVFIPMSGWLADRFTARVALRTAICIFRLWFSGVYRIVVIAHIHIRPFRARHRWCNDGDGPLHYRRARCAEERIPTRHELVERDVDRRADHCAATRWSHHHLSALAADVLHQRGIYLSSRYLANT